jgi:hypothetical protein
MARTPRMMRWSISMVVAVLWLTCSSAVEAQVLRCNIHSKYQCEAIGRRNDHGTANSHRPPDGLNLGCHPESKSDSLERFAGPAGPHLPDGT